MSYKSDPENPEYQYNPDYPGLFYRGSGGLDLY
jgi:hypothetical protein